MKNEDRLIEIMAELLAEVHEMRTDTRKQLTDSNKRLISVEHQQRRTNLAISELRLSIMKLAKHIENQTELEKRVKKLEKVVYNGH